MLRAGRVDLITQSEPAAGYLLQKMGERPEDFEMVYVLQQLDMYFAFNRATDPVFLESLQAGLEAMKRADASGVSPYDRIVSKYLINGGLGGE